MLHPSQSLRFDHPNHILWSLQCQFSPVSYYVLHLGLDILLGILISNTLNACSYIKHPQCMFLYQTPSMHVLISNTLNACSYIKHPQCMFLDWCETKFHTHAINIFTFSLIKYDFTENFSNYFCYYILHKSIQTKWNFSIDTDKLVENVNSAFLYAIMNSVYSCDLGDEKSWFLPGIEPPLCSSQSVTLADWLRQHDSY
jgi:hypothetical protein